MELNWSTFVLEIINFLILLWILKHFLYRPILNIIEQRRNSIDTQLQEAESKHREAQQLLAEYNNRLQSWQQERQQALHKTEQECQALRREKLQQLDHELKTRQQTAEVAAHQAQQAALDELQRSALRQSSEFASRLLTPLATPALEASLLQLLLERLASLSDAQLQQLQGDGTQQITPQVSSVWPLSDEQRGQLQDSLSRLWPDAAPASYQQDGTLLAGIRIIAGGHVLAASLSDELKAFSEFESASGGPAQ